MRELPMRGILKKLKTLKVKFTVITFFTYMALVTVTLLASYNHFFSNMISIYESIGEEILNLASDDIIIDHIPDYLSGDYDKEEYDTTRKRMDRYVSYYKEIYYLYAYKINGDDRIATIIFDAQTDHDVVQVLGEDYELEDDVYSNIDKLQKGEVIDALIDNTEWGYLLTCSKPLIGSDGVCQGYILVDFNLTETRAKDIEFILQLFSVVFFLTLVILFFAMKAVSGRITGPIEKMYLCFKSFRFDTDEDRKENIKRLKALDIKTNQEIQSLYETLVSTSSESYTYQHEYQDATEQLGVAKAMAYRDPLTGVGNKNAYDRKVKAIQKRIECGESVELAFMMIDINNLKYINDTFGHIRGDAYIKGCCEIIKEQCRDSRIYRLGGDEFVVLLKGNAYRDRQVIYTNMVKIFDLYHMDEGKEPWERYSASVGMADYYSYDTSVVDAIRRADRAMYDAKTRFKEKYGSYR